MRIVGTIAAVTVGLAVGVLVGWVLGRRVRGDARGYWLLNAVVLLSCAALDFAGLMLGRMWLAYGALGLMGGAIGGLKYGYLPSTALWLTRQGTSTHTHVGSAPEVTDPLGPDGGE